MAMEKWMIVYVLPLEVWMDIFCFPWISREEFGRLVDRIGNFKFTEHAQFFLHEWGKRKLGELFFDKDGLYKYADSNDEDEDEPYRLEYPQTPMPENIKSFDYIKIEHFDAQTIDFLGKIRSLLTDVEICVGVLVDIPLTYLDNFHTILTTLAPMLDEIRSLYCSNETLFFMAKEELFRDNQKLTKLKWLDSNFYPKTASEMERQENVAFIMNWLAQSDLDEPRLFEFTTCYEFAEKIRKAIREQFNAAQTPRTFIVNYLKLYSSQERPVADFHLENGIGEELHGEWTGKHRDVFQLTRHRADRKTKEVRKWIEAMTKGKDDRRIIIWNPTVGSLDAAQMVVPPVDGEINDQQQKPCSSKDA